MRPFFVEGFSSHKIRNDRLLIFRVSSVRLDVNDKVHHKERHTSEGSPASLLGHVDCLWGNEKVRRDIQIYDLHICK